MGSVCISLKQLLAEPRFRKLQEMFPERAPVELKAYLQLYRSERRKDDDWYPDDEFRAAFGTFLHNQDRRAKLESSKKVSESKNALSNYEAVLSAFTHAQLEDAIDYLASEFRSYLDIAAEDNPGLSRAKVLKNAGGFETIIGYVIQDLQEETVDDIYQNLLQPREHQEGELTQAQKEELYQIAEGIHTERNTILDYKEHLVTRAASRIGEIEGIRFEYGGMLTDWQNSGKEQTASDDEEIAKREEGVSKGSRFVDFRERDLASTLTPRAKRFISGIPMYQPNGIPYVTIFGKARTMDYQQVALPLFRVLEGVEPRDMMRAIQDGAKTYPWMSEIYDQLEAHPDMKPVIYTTFARVTKRYASEYVDNGEYRVGAMNSGAKDYSVVRHMLTNMMEGNFLDSPYSIYDGDGRIVKTLDYKKIAEELSVLRQKLGGVEMRIDRKPTNPYGQHEYMKHIGKESADAFMSVFGNDIAKIVLYARGIGLDVDAEDIKHVLYSEMPNTSKDFPSYHNRAELLVSHISNIYKMASKGKYADADTLSNFIDKEMKAINFAMARAVYDEVEQRTRLGKKTISALDNPNLTHIQADILTNNKGLSDEQYRDSIEKEWLQYEGYTIRKEYHVGDEGTTFEDVPFGWLGKFYASPRLAQQTQLVQLLEFNGVDYAHMSDGQKALSTFVAWDDKNGTHFQLPMAADYGSSYDFLKVPPELLKDLKTGRNATEEEKKSYNSDIVPIYQADIDKLNVDAPIVKAFAEEVIAELQRMDAIEERIQDESRIKLSTYEENGMRFSVFPEFNEMGFREKYLSMSPARAYDYLMKEVARQLDKIVKRDVAKLDSLGLHRNKYAKYFEEYTDTSRGWPEKRYRLTPYYMGRFQEFSLQQYYAAIQIDRIFTGGFSHFPSIFEYEKRCMFRHAPHTALYMEGDQNIVYVDDDVTASAYVDELSEMTEALYREGRIDEAQRDEMIRQYESIKDTDGQGVRTIPSYLKLIEGMGVEDVQAYKDAWQRIKSGTQTKDDINMFLFSTQKLVGAGFEHIPAAQGELQKPIKNPVFHKYSEIVLLAPELMKYSMQARSAYMEGFSRAANQLKNQFGFDVDLFLFKSNVKLGFHSGLSPLAVDKERGIRLHPTADSIQKYLVDKIKSDPDRYLHRIPWKYYGKAATMPTDIVDMNISMPSQSVKAVWSNLTGVKDGTETLHLHDRDIEATEGRDLYYEMQTADVIDAYHEVQDLLDDKKELEKLFQEEIASKSYSTDDMMYALSLLENGNFSIPLCSPTVAKQVQEMLFSIINKRMTRPKVKGAHIAIYSAVGIDESAVPFAPTDMLPDEELLGIEFEGEGENRRIVGLDCILPVFDSRLDIFTDKNGMITPKRMKELTSGDDPIIPPELFHFYGLRTPTDDLHSVIPFIAKALTARVAGAGLGMSKEAAKMDGHDNDGDEEHCYFRDFDIVWHEGKIRELYRSRKEFSTIGLGTYVSEEEFIGWFTEDALEKKEARNELLKKIQDDKHKIRLDDFKKVKLVEYDYNKSALENTKRQRDAGRKELLRAQLTSIAGSRRLIIPTNNTRTDIQAKATAIVKAINQRGDETLLYRLMQKARDIEQEAKADGVNIVVNLDENDLYRSLFRQPLDVINKLYEVVSGGQSPYSFTYTIEAFRRVMGGASLIDVFALYSSAHRLLQSANLYYIEHTKKSGERIPVTFFGTHRIGQLLPTQIFSDDETDRRFATTTMDAYLQSSVDNTKNPILGLLNVSQELADIISFLSAAGISEERMNMILPQPVMEELVRRLSDHDSHGFTDEAESIIIDLLGYQPDILDAKHKYQAISRFGSYMEDDFIDQIPMSYQQLKYEGSASQKQMAADLLYVLIHLNPDASLLSDVIRATRPEATTATVGPNIARTSVKLDRLNTLRDKINNPDNPVHIGGLNELLDRIDRNAITDEELFNATKGPAQYMRALNSLMFDKVMEWMERYFPQARKTWYELATGLAKRYSYRTLQEGIVQQVFADMLTWKMMQNAEFMGDIESRREDLMIELPNRLKSIKDRVRAARRALKSGGQPKGEIAAKLVDNIFLDHLGSQKIDGIKRIKFYAGGPVTGRLQGKISSDWADLVQSEDEEVRQLGIDLYMYNFITNGTRFGMYEFAHFAPLNVLWNVPGLINAMETALSSDFTPGSVDTQRFVHQYYMNHWQDNRLVPVIELDELPNGLRERFGLTTVIDDRMKKTVPLQKILGYHYILIRQKNLDPQSSNTKKTQYVTKLYRVQVNKDEINPIERPKLGRKGKHGQMTIQYNPYMSQSDIRPFAVQREENASLEAAKIAGQRWGNTPSLRSDLGIGEPNSAPPSLREEAGLPPVGNDRPSLRADLGLASPVANDNSKPMGLRETLVAQMKQEEQAEKAVRNNEEILQNIPEDVPGSFSEPVTEFVENDDIDDISYDANDDYRSEYVQGIDDGNAADDNFSDEPAQSNDAPALYNTLDGYDESIERDYDDEPNTKMPHLEIATREGALVKTRNVLITPDSINEARRQKAYVELNKRLRQILRDNGIAVGAISSVEARMAMSGVTDFGSAKVTAEGLKELIRIADGARGEEALPEEFAHMALEMLGRHHPLVERLLSELQRSDEGLREVFGDYYDAYLDYYKNDMDMMLLEAAGKLVAKQLLYQQEVKTTGLRGLIKRIVDAIKNLLRKIGIRQIDDAILDAEGIASQLARDLLSGRLADELSLDNVTESGKMADLKKDITKDNDILSKMLKIEMKRLQVLKRRLAYRKDEKSHESVVATEHQITRLESAIKSKKTESAIYSYISNAIDFLRASEKSLDQVIASGRPANVVCKKLRVTQDVIYSYKLALKNIKEAIDNKELADSDTLRDTRDKFNGILNELLDKTDRISLHYFQGTLRDFYGEDGLTITAGKERGRHISIEEMSKKGDRDVSIISRWVHSMGDCNDLVLKMIDGIVKKAKYTARRDTDRIQQDINTAFADLVKKTGSRDQGFMFARNPETGKRTGEYITEEASKKLDPARKEFYDRIMKLKKGVDKLLPESKVSDLKMIMLRKTSLDKAREAELKNKGKYLWEYVRNSVMETSESIDYDFYEVETDFENNRVDKLPLLYTTKGKKESYDDMTEDVATSLLAYAGMANEYYQLNNILGEIENARYMSSRRQITQRAGQKLQRETVTKDDGLSFYQDFTVPQMRTNIQLVLEDFLQMHVYGHLRRNEGTFGRTKISKRKTVDTLNAITSYSQLAINLPQRIANVTVGGANIIIQAADKGMFNMKDLLWATKIYGEHTANRLLDTGAIDISDKLSLFSEYFDVSQDNGRRFKNAKYERSKVGRVMNTNLLYSGLMIGEDYLANTTALALARNYKVKGPDGKTYNLWDAYEVKFRDTTNKTGAYLSLREGFTKTNGMPITEEDERKFMNRVAATNFELQGIYNQDDKSAIQSTALGALVMMYRKWMAPALKRRYGATHYDHLREEYEEGYWRTTGRYLMDSFQSIVKEGEGILGSWTLNFDKLTDYEKSNLRKALRETAIIVGVLFSIALLEKFPPDDDDNKFIAWADQMFLYQLYRLRNEIGSQAPTHLFVKETLRLFESPFAAVEPMKNVLELYKLLLPSSYITEVKNGPYKGHTKAYKYIWDLPPLCLAKHWQRFKNPSSMINFYRNDMK